MRVYSIETESRRGSTKLLVICSLLFASLMAGPFGPATAAPLVNQPSLGPAAARSASLTSTEVKTMVVGHSVALSDGSMTWYFNPDGTYDADDGRNGRSGRYAVQADGKLCWSETTGIKGCFQYYRQAGKLMVRRADPGHSTVLGAVTLGAL